LARGTEDGGMQDDADPGGHPSGPGTGGAAPGPSHRHLKCSPAWKTNSLRFSSRGVTRVLLQAIHQSTDRRWSGAGIRRPEGEGGGGRRGARGALAAGGPYTAGSQLSKAVFPIAVVIVTGPPPAPRGPADPVPRPVNGSFGRGGGTHASTPKVFSTRSFSNKKSRHRTSREERPPLAHCIADRVVVGRDAGKGPRVRWASPRRSPQRGCRRATPGPGTAPAGPRKTPTPAFGRMKILKK